MDELRLADSAAASVAGWFSLELVDEVLSEVAEPGVAGHNGWFDREDLTGVCAKKC